MVTGGPTESSLFNTVTYWIVLHGKEGYFFLSKSASLQGAFFFMEFDVRKSIFIEFNVSQKAFSSTVFS